MQGHFAWGFTVVLIWNSAASGEAPAFREPDCGTNALFLLLRLSGQPTSLIQIERSLPRQQSGGNSMTELREAARGHGLRLRGSRFGKGDVPLDRPVIAYLSRPGEGHFVVLRPVGVMGTMVQVLDPPHAPAIMDYTHLLGGGLWTGRVLMPQTTGEWLAAQAWWVIVPLVPLALFLVPRWRLLRGSRRQSRVETAET